MESKKTGFDRLREEAKKHDIPEAEVDRLKEQLKNYEPPSRGEVVRCSKCGRKVLIEQVLIGVDHTSKTIANCWDCLDDKTREKAKEAYHLKTE